VENENLIKTLEDFETCWRDVGLDETLKHQDQKMTILPPDRGQKGVIGPLRKLETHANSTFPELLMTGTLGEGGMGIIRLAQQTALGREVAVKTLRTGTVLSRDAVSGLLSEACITGILEHPNIVPIYTLGEGSNGEPLVVMKRIEGRTWYEFFKDPKLIESNEFGDNLGWHINVLMQVCNAIHYAHSKSILHRDLKPENVMIGGFGEVFLLDWGIAVTLDDSYRDRFPKAIDVSSPAGTPSYMAPEMASGLGAKLCVQTDVYLLGALLHEIITGSPPHQGGTVMQIIFAAYRAEIPHFPSHVPEGLAAICRRAMEPDPNKRFPSAEAFRRALAEFTRHRESIQLEKEASQKLGQICLLIESEPGKQESLLIQQTFIESRFGFDQALRIWPENTTVHEQKERLILIMCEYELSQHNVSAASTLLKQLNAPPENLRRQIEILKYELDRQSEELETLRKDAKENDISVEARKRGILLGLFGLATIMWQVPNLVLGGSVIELNRNLYLYLLLPYILIMMILTYFGRNVFFANRANRQAALSLFIVFGVACFHRIVVFIAQSDPHAAIANELMLYTAAILLTALNIERRLILSAIPFALGYVLAILEPSWALEIFGFAAGGGVIMMSVIWILPQAKNDLPLNP
jgi:serine/threonine protein kinase